ncbi:Eco57I restriction-modification methylase domain-containing protein [Actinomadura welshii]|uniref:Eco57I restriction-modification methylase domain-containing protein n=1 Tax=Actinomadura welshii TaxID=3103817 RepID=UPI0009DDBFEC|nr:N-6 DNA methylase [Actinomadura madurae]
MVIRTKDKFQAYFTTSEPIIRYMVEMLQPEPGQRILEPSAGHGAFIEALLEQTPNVDIDAYELNEDSFLELKRRFSGKNNVSAIHANTLVQQGFGPSGKAMNVYDRVIANPPYGAWLDYSERDQFKTLFPGIYAKETYALFLALSIRLLKPGGRLVFIIPETFLTLHRHSRLRESILTQCKVQEIAIFPSRFFPGVSFGYAKLCIITLLKESNKDACLANSLTVRSDFSKPDMLTGPAEFDGVAVKLIQDDVYEASDHAFLVHETSSVTSLLHSSDYPRLGEIAACVTGFYSGDDRRFLRHNSPHARSARRYEQIEEDVVTTSPTDEEKSIGISGDRRFVPIRKGGSAEYVALERWYMDWSGEAVRHYKSDKKARFQNSQYYFRHGIGVPMVSSKRVKAALIRGELFDQSIVGIFPQDEDLIPYLLGLFNSSTGNTLIRTVNPSANNSANYLKKVPIIIPDAATLEAIARQVGEIIASLESSPSADLTPFRQTIDDTYREIYGF